jgi:hypothetical protein
MRHYFFMLCSIGGSTCDKNAFIICFCLLPGSNAAVAPRLRRAREAAVLVFENHLAAPENAR